MPAGRLVDPADLEVDQAGRVHAECASRGGYCANVVIAPGGQIRQHLGLRQRRCGPGDGRERILCCASSSGLSLYPVTPCRVIDTRNLAPFNGVLLVSVEGSACAPPSTAQAYVMNATVIPIQTLGYLTLWPAGESQPVVSTLNATSGAVTSNMAIVPTNNGVISASGTTQRTRSSPPFQLLCPVDRRRGLQRERLIEGRSAIRVVSCQLSTINTGRFLHSVRPRRASVEMTKSVWNRHGEYGAGEPRISPSARLRRASVEMTEWWA